MQRSPHLKVFFNWCYQEELIDSDPSVRLKTPRPEKRVLKTFRSEHIYKMLDSLDLSTDMGFRDYVILLLLLDTGIRLNEIGTLLLEDVHDTYIKVRGKGRKEREVGIHPDLGKLLWKYMHKYRHPGNPDEPKIFIDCTKQGKGKAISGPGVKGILTRLRMALDFKDVHLSPHTFIHTFARMYMAQGGDIFKLSHEMGHSSVRITQRYLEDFDSTAARKEHDSYSPLSALDISRYRKGIKKKNA